MEKAKILIIDDDTDISFAFKTILENHNFTVETAGDSESGMYNAKQFVPDLMVLDVNMTTRYEGFEMCRSIRKDIDLKNIPIIILTGLDIMTLSQQAKDMHEDLKGHRGDEFFLMEDLNKIGYNSDGSMVVTESFLTKPIDPDDLIAEINSILGK